VVYEMLRKRTGEDVHLAKWSWAVFTCVGVSYGLRSAMGLWFGTQGIVRGGVLVGFFAVFYLMGVSIVMMNWVLETTSFMHQTDPIPAPVAKNLRQKAHLVYLGRRAGLLQTSSNVYDRDNPSTLSKSRWTERPLQGCPRFVQPWDIAIVAAAGLAMVVGSGISDGRPFRIDALDLLALPFGGLVGMLTVVWPKASQLRLRIVIALLGGAMVATVTVRIYHDRSLNALWALVPAIAVVTTYQFTRMMNYCDAQSLPEVLGALPVKAAAFIAEVWNELRR
jgi:uncharacterized membrane protein YhaH (DUF805 family)